MTPRQKLIVWVAIVALMVALVLSTGVDVAADGTTNESDAIQRSQIHFRYISAFDKCCQKFGHLGSCLPKGSGVYCKCLKYVDGKGSGPGPSEALSSSTELAKFVEPESVDDCSKIVRKRSETRQLADLACKDCCNKFLFSHFYVDVSIFKKCHCKTSAKATSQDSNKNGST
jgi:hypothetical protein